VIITDKTAHHPPKVLCFCFAITSSERYGSPKPIHIFFGQIAIESFAKANKVLKSHIPSVCIVQIFHRASNLQGNLSFHL
jgi:hypothetical protein